MGVKLDETPTDLDQLDETLEAENPGIGHRAEAASHWAGRLGLPHQRVESEGHGGQVSREVVPQGHQHLRHR